MPAIHSSIACNLDADILMAALPLFDSEKVQAIEWSFDTLFNKREIPPWFVELLQEYGQAGRLIGHGVIFSIFSGKWLPEQQRWLDHLERKSKAFHFDHITEHFGFMTGEDFHKGAPISIPFTASTLSIGQDRLKRIYNACQCPVGLENLAFSYSLDEVKKHGEFLERLIEPVNGFIILDLHNLYCQLHNFDVEFDDIIQLYPLEKVREIHISGGSWEGSYILPEKKIRRDTHDESVPDAVFELLSATLEKCPNLKYVVLEQLGTGLKTELSRQLFQQDFLRMDAIVGEFNSRNIAGIVSDFLPKKKFELNAPVEDLTLHAQQLELSAILENAAGFEDANRQIQSSQLAGSDWETERWAPFMLETAPTSSSTAC